MPRREAIDFLDLQFDSRGQAVGPLSLGPHFFNQLILIDQISGQNYQLTVENGTLVVVPVNIV